MAVLLYQIGIFAAIQIAALFGKSAKNTAVILITIFTLLQVFMSWLLLLQLITIFISYQFSKRFLSDKPSTTTNKNAQKNVLHSYRDENGGRVVTEVDLNDEKLNKTVRERATLQNKIREDSVRKYDSDSGHKSLIDNIVNNMVSGNSTGSSKISLNTQFYYIERANTFGPISAKKLVGLVKSKRINRNCFVRQVSEKRYENRAYEIVDLLEK